jgi:insertion element IS1 protein InsB
MPPSKKVEALPPFEASVLPAKRGDSIECDEVWAYVGSKKHQAWLWRVPPGCWSFQTTQTLCFAVGARDEATGRAMWSAIPRSYGRKQAYTDEYGVYDKLIPWGRHWVCPKGSGDTCIANGAEGCNNYLRHRVSYLVRKSPSFARNRDWLYRRVFLVLFTRNERLKERWNQQLAK